MPITAEIRESDAKGRITLPRSFANSTLLLEWKNDRELVIRKAKVTPLGDEIDLPPLVTLKPLSDRDRDKFLAALDGPAPEPTAALVRAMKAARTAKKPRK